MNLTLTLLLTHNLGPLDDTDWTVDIITKVTDLYFKRRGDIFVFHYFPEEPEDLVMEKVLCHMYNKRDFLVSYLNGTQGTDPPEFIKPNGILLFIEFSKLSYQTIATDFLMKILKNLHLKVRLIVVLQYHKLIKEGVISFLLEKFWNLNLRNVIIVNSVINDLTPPSVKIFYWRHDFDFKKHTKIKAKNIRRIILTKEDDQESVNKTLKNREMLSLVDVRDIRGHFMNVSVAVTPPYVWWKAKQYANLAVKQHENLTTDRLDGIEVMIVKEFREKFNLTGYFIIHPSEIIEIGELENEADEDYGVLEETALGMSDIAIGGNLATADLYSFFGPSLPYFEDNMHWYVPGPKAFPLWMNNFLIFDGSMWLCAGLSFLLTGIVVFAWFRIGSNRDMKIDFSSSALFAWALVVSQSVPHNLPGRLKIFFISAIFCGMHISYFYTSGLIIAIHKVYYEPPITTLKEAKEANMMLCLSGISYDFFRSQNLSMDGNVTSNVYLDYSDCLDEVAEKRSSIALVPEKTTEYTIPLRYLDENFMEKICKMPKRLISYPVSMYLTKASPYKPALNFVITGLLEGGLLEKWWREIRFSGPRKEKDKIVLSGRMYNSISLKNAWAIFFLFLILQVFSVASFAAEIVWFRMTTWKKNRRNESKAQGTFKRRKYRLVHRFD